jgi:hypothetical protein
VHGWWLQDDAAWIRAKGMPGWSRLSRPFRFGQSGEISGGTGKFFPVVGKIPSGKAVSTLGLVYAGGR